MSFSAFRGRTFGRIHSTSVFLALFTFLTTVAAHPQTAPPAPAAPAPAVPAPAPHIDSVAVFPQAVSQATSTQDFVLEINGTGFASIDMNNVHIAVFPATAVTSIQVLSRSLDNSKILAQFTAPANYVLEEIALSTGSDLLPFNAGTVSCDFKSKVKLTPQMVPKVRPGISMEMA